MKRLWMLSVAIVLALGTWAAAESTGAESGHGEAHKDPQLLVPPSSKNPETIITALTTLVVFLVLLIVLSKFAWGPIVSGLRAREDRIRRDIADAEATRTKAEATLRDYNTRLAEAENRVRELLQKASVDAEQLATQIRARAQQESEEAKERATRDIETARKQAITDIYAQAAELSTKVAEKILRRNLNGDDQRELIRGSLEQLQNANKG